MLDLLERLGIDFDASDRGHSVMIHSRLFPRAKPQSICSRVIELELWPIAFCIGFWHCLRSYERYH